MAADERMWRIGEVATATGLTVRALHHYDQIGLVAPSVRTSGGHRLYTSADLVLLYEVTAMRQLGLSLDQVGIVLSISSLSTWTRSGWRAGSSISSLRSSG
jgi:DNA-binding transcriptional MerR regulator